MMRNLSGNKEERVETSKLYNLASKSIVEENMLMGQLEEAFYAASIINHVIGFEALATASLEYNWDLDLSEIARVWTNGCIIRSGLVEKISELYKSVKEKRSLLKFPEIVNILKQNYTSLSSVVSKGLMAGCPLPVLSSSLNYFLTYTSAQSSANMIQAQRDYFGAHTYQRVDKPISEFFHTNWKS